MNQREAWKCYDLWLAAERVAFLEEPSGLEIQFRQLTASQRASPKDWADSYLASFAQAARLTLVTFDQALGEKSRDAVVLQP